MASREPCLLLRPHVRRLVGYDERSLTTQRQIQFPEPFVVLIIEFGPPVRVVMGGDERNATRNPGGFVAGLGDVVAVVEHAGHQRGIQVDLTPCAARKFFGIPLSEIRGSVVALRDLEPRDHPALCERLDTCHDWAERLDLVEAVLARRILGARVDTRQIDWAVARIEASGGSLRVGSLSRELGCSPKHLISLFHDQVGVSPKVLASLVRFERVMREIRGGTRSSLADLATAHGYSDQAHLARDVKRFTGLTATEARRSRSEFADLFG